MKKSVTETPLAGKLSGSRVPHQTATPPLPPSPPSPPASSLGSVPSADPAMEPVVHLPVSQRWPNIFFGNSIQVSRERIGSPLIPTVGTAPTQRAATVRTQSGPPRPAPAAADPRSPAPKQGGGTSAPSLAALASNRQPIPQSSARIEVPTLKKALETAPPQPAPALKPAPVKPAPSARIVTPKPVAATSPSASSTAASKTTQTGRIFSTEKSVESATQRTPTTPKITHVIPANTTPIPGKPSEQFFAADPTRPGASTGIEQGSLFKPPVLNPPPASARPAPVPPLPSASRVAPVAPVAPVKPATTPPVAPLSSSSPSSPSSPSPAPKATLPEPASAANSPDKTQKPLRTARMPMLASGPIAGGRREIWLGNGERISGGMLAEIGDNLSMEHPVLGVLNVPKSMVAHNLVEVFMRNGDRLVGELFSETDETVVMEHSSLGVISIPRIEICGRVASFKLANGDRLVGEVVDEGPHVVRLRSSALGVVTVPRAGIETVLQKTY